MLFYYVYVLESLYDRNNYVGFTSNLNRRLKEHRMGLNFSTKFRLPFRIIYFEACTNMKDAKRREQYLKTTQGRKFLGLRLSCYKTKKALGN